MPTVARGYSLEFLQLRIHTYSPQKSRWRVKAKKGTADENFDNESSSEGAGQMLTAGLQILDWYEILSGRANTGTILNRIESVCSTPLR